MDANPSLPPHVWSLLQTAQASHQRMVVMTCGPSGAGKSTLSTTIVAKYPNFTRLSIDAYIFQHYGVFGKDYAKEVYESLQDKAREWIKGELTRVVRAGCRDVVLDLSLWGRGQRDEWRELVEREGRGKYQVCLVVFRGDEERIWRRIQGREEKWDSEGMGEGRPIARELLRVFLEAFEWPDGEGEIVIEVG